MAANSGKKMDIVRELPEAVWRDFVAEHPAGNIFHTPEMFQVFGRARGHRPEVWAAVHAGEALALLTPVQVTLMGGLARLLTTRAIAYGGVLYTPDPAGEQALAVLLATYKREVGGWPLFTELRNLSDMAAAQPILRRQGFAYEEHLNYLIDLDRSPEAIMESIGARTRKNIRRALRRGDVRVEEAQEHAQLPLCYGLLRRTYQAAKVPLADPSLFEAAFDVLYPKGMARFTLAWVGETPVATSVELLYKEIAYGWYGGVDRAYGEYMPNEILTWRILEWCAENGYRTYDFGGAGKPGEEYGVRDFKAKFGGALVNYGRNTCVHAPFRLAVSKIGYRLYRR